MKIIITPFIIAILLLAGYIGYMRFFANEQNIKIFGYSEYIVATGSMEPFCNVGDLVIVKSVEPGSLKVNDVITYLVQKGGDTVTHRIVECVEKDGQILYRTKGDNNNSADPELVAYEDIQGLVIHKIDKLGVFITNIMSTAGMMIVILIITLSYLRSNRKEEKRIAREDARRQYNIPKYEKEETII